MNNSNEFHQKNVATNFVEPIQIQLVNLCYPATIVKKLKRTDFMIVSKQILDEIRV